MTKDDFRKRCHQVVDNWVVNDIDRVINKMWTMGAAKALKLEDEPDDFRIIYAFMGAFFEKCAKEAISGSTNERERKLTRTKANKFKTFL